jgi:hypothetical protein
MEHVEEDLKHRRVIEISLQVQFFNQLLEGHVLVLKRFKSRRSHPREQLVEGRIAGQIGA